MCAADDCNSGRGRSPRRQPNQTRPPPGLRRPGDRQADGQGLSDAAVMAFAFGPPATEDWRFLAFAEHALGRTDDAGTETGTQLGHLKGKTHSV